MPGAWPRQGQGICGRPSSVSASFTFAQPSDDEPSLLYRQSTFRFVFYRASFAVFARLSGPLYPLLSPTVPRFAIANHSAPRHLIKTVHRRSHISNISPPFRHLAQPYYRVLAHLDRGPVSLFKNYLRTRLLGHSDPATYNPETGWHRLFSASRTSLVDPQLSTLFPFVVS